MLWIVVFSRVYKGRSDRSLEVEHLTNVSLVGEHMFQVTEVFGVSANLCVYKSMSV